MYQKLRETNTLRVAPLTVIYFNTKLDIALPQKKNVFNIQEAFITLKTF